MPLAATQAQSRLLHALPESDLTRLGPMLEPVALALGAIVCDRERLLDFVYFPTDSVAALVHTVADGHTAASALIGNEGVVGGLCDFG